MPRSDADTRARWSPSLATGLALVALLVVAAVLAPWLAPQDPLAQLDPAGGRYQPPFTRLAAVELADGGWLLAEEVRRLGDEVEIVRLGRQRRLAATEVVNLSEDGVADRLFYLLGSDGFGRDVLSRTLYGARLSLAIAFLAVVLAVGLGVVVGGVSGMAGGAADLVIMRGVEAFLAFPRLFLVLALAALVGPSAWVVVLVLGATGWMGVARLVRSRVLEARQLDYVLAARAQGQAPPHIFLRHLLPHATTPLTVDAALRLGEVILLEASLSFLGLGIQPPFPSWGNMVAEGAAVLETAWWVTLFPGLAIALTVVAFNLVADGLRHTLDPHGAASDVRALPTAVSARS